MLVNFFGWLDRGCGQCCNVILICSAVLEFEIVPLYLWAALAFYMVCRGYEVNGVCGGAKFGLDFNVLHQHMNEWNSVSLSLKI
jgi:hypothetical protein